MMEDQYNYYTEEDIFDKEKEFGYKNEDENIFTYLNQFLSYLQEINTIISDLLEKPLEKINSQIQNYKFVDKSMIESLIKIKQNLYSKDNRKSSNINKTTIKTICNKKLDELINILDDIKKKVEKIKKDNESETNNSLNCIIKNQQFLTDIMDKMEKKQDKSRKVFLYNKQKLINFNEDYLLSMNILNNECFKLRLLNKNNLKIKFEYPLEKFEKDINDFRCFFGELENGNNSCDFEDNENYQNNIRAYLLVSSKINKLNVYGIDFDFDVDRPFDINNNNLLNKINTKEFIFTEQSSENSIDLSSFAIRVNNNNRSEIYGAFSEGKSIKMYSILGGKFDNEIKLENPYKIKYCEIVKDKYFLFCGKDETDHNICAIRVDLDIINGQSINLNRINYIKYIDNSDDNKNNIHLDFRLYTKKNKEKKDEDFLIICDEKGYFRIFNFYNRDFIKKIHYIYNNSDWKDIFNVFFWIRESCQNIILIKSNGNDERLKNNSENYIDLDDTEIISYKKYVIKYFPSETNSLRNSQ